MPSGIVIDGIARKHNGVAVTDEDGAPCCCDIEPGEFEFLRAKPCDACGGDTIPIWVDPAVLQLFNNPPWETFDCIYFKLLPPHPNPGCYFIHRDDRVETLPFDPQDFLTGDHAMMDIHSCCVCCTEECAANHRDNSQSHPLFNFFEWLRENGIEPPFTLPDYCCCDTVADNTAFSFFGRRRLTSGGLANNCDEPGDTPRPLEYVRVRGAWVGRLGVDALRGEAQFGNEPLIRGPATGFADREGCLRHAYATMDADGIEMKVDPLPFIYSDDPDPGDFDFAELSGTATCERIQLRVDVWWNFGDPPNSCFREELHYDLRWRDGSNVCFEPCAVTNPKDRPITDVSPLLGVGGSL